jgi:hypothetical protein
MSKEDMTTEGPFLDEAPLNDDEELGVRMAQNGDPESLEWLVRRHSPWIYNIALRMLCHPDDAQDASQEILVKVITRLSTFEGRSSFRTWPNAVDAQSTTTMTTANRRMAEHAKVMDALRGEVICTSEVRSTQLTHSRDDPNNLTNAAGTSDSESPFSKATCRLLRSRRLTGFRKRAPAVSGEYSPVVLREFLTHEYAGHLEAGRQGDVAAFGFHETMAFVELDGSERRFDLDCGRSSCPTEGLR